MNSLLYPPLNFAFVESGLYRSAYTNEVNNSFLSTLSLRSIVVLDEFCPQEMEDFAASNHITILPVRKNNLC